MRAGVLATIVAMAGCAAESDLGLPCTEEADCNEGHCAMDKLCTAATDLRTVTLDYACTPALKCSAWPRFSTTPTGGIACDVYYCANVSLTLGCAPGAATGQVSVFDVPIRFDTVQTMWTPSLLGWPFHDPMLVSTAQVAGNHADVAVYCYGF